MQARKGTGIGPEVTMRPGALSIVYYDFEQTFWDQSREDNHPSLCGSGPSSPWRGSTVPFSPGTRPGADAQRRRSACTRLATRASLLPQPAEIARRMHDPLDDHQPVVALRA